MLFFFHYVIGDDMKKTFLLLLFIIVIYVFIGYKFNNVVISDDAIRIRILANSNSSYDQGIKNGLKNKVQDYMYDLLKDVKDVGSARKIIKSNLDNVCSLTSKYLIDNNYNMNYSVNFGKNYFPEKEYKGVKYNEGNYESLLITLGNGFGDNWWCVLFPPLCLIEVEDSDNVSYTTLVGELLKKYSH